VRLVTRKVQAIKIDRAEKNAGRTAAEQWHGSARPRSNHRSKGMSMGVDR
jgi:hypothetical protein